MFYLFLRLDSKSYPPFSLCKIYNYIVVIGTRSQPSIGWGIVILSPYSLSPLLTPPPDGGGRDVNLREFDEAIGVNLVLVDNSMRRRNPHT